MANISSRVDKETAEDLESYAEERGISKSQAVDELLDAGLSVRGDEGPELEATPELDKLNELQNEAEQLVSQYQQKVSAQRGRVERLLDDHIDLADISEESISAFAEQPYKVIPKGEEEYYVVVPRFIPFSVGHLLEQDNAWNVFVVNKYVSWIEDIPTEIREKVDIGNPYDKAVVQDGMLELSDEEERDRAWDDLGGRDGGLHARKGENKIKIQKGYEFDIISDLVEAGNLPFAPKHITEDDLRGEPEGVELRPYQERAWDKFTEYGQVGVYWPPGLGKTFLSLYAGERVSGVKLVVVPSSTLEEQWQERICELCSNPEEWEVRTYQYLTYGDNMQEYTDVNGPKLTIFDECHTLPANTFSKLATLETDYRIGLSATPYREDERTDYIFALTGVPVGIEWEELLEYGDFEYPEVSVFIYRTQNQKVEDLAKLVKEGTGKTLVFCDSIDEGEKLSEELGIPFVQGETPKADRMDTFRDNNVIIGSRVADEGLSLDELDRVIEYDFHGASRRQELQRAGRVMHSESIGQHIVQMTDQEYDKFSERLYSLEEKGIDIRLERRG